jgi:hypothetical protein
MVVEAPIGFPSQIAVNGVGSGKRTTALNIAVARQSYTALMMPLSRPIHSHLEQSGRERFSLVQREAVLT